MIRLYATFALLLVSVALIGCGSSDGETVSIGIDTDGSSITMLKAEALDYLFEDEEGLAQLSQFVCRTIRIKGLSEAKKFFVKNFDAELEEDFSAQEIFGEAASRC